MMGVLIRRPWEDRETRSERAVRRHTGPGELEEGPYKPRNIQDCWQPPAAGGQAWSRLSLAVPEKEPVLPAPWFGTPRLQSCERTHCCCFKAPSSQCLVMAALVHDIQWAVASEEAGSEQSLACVHGKGRQFSLWGARRCPVIPPKITCTWQWAKVQSDRQVRQNADHKDRFLCLWSVSVLFPEGLRCWLPEFAFNTQSLQVDIR